MKTMIASFGLASVLFAGSALAATAPDAAPAQAQTSEARVLYVCDKTTETKRAFERKFGEIRFVTAEQALRSADKKEVWTTPRCMTDANMEKMVAMQAKRATFQNASIK